MMETELHNITHNNLSSARGKTGYNIAYKILLGALRDALKANTPETGRLVNICLDNMDSCLTKAESIKEQYYAYAAFDSDLTEFCDKRAKEIIAEYAKNLSHDQHALLAELRKRRLRLTNAQPPYSSDE